MKYNSPPQMKDKWRTLLLTKLISLKHPTNIKLTPTNSRNNPVSFNYHYGINHNHHNYKKESLNELSNDSNCLSKLKLPSIKQKELNSNQEEQLPLDKDQPRSFLSQGVQTFSPLRERRPQYHYSTPPKIRIKMLRFPNYDSSNQISIKKKNVACKSIQTPQNYNQAMIRYLNNNLSKSTKNVKVNYTTAIKVIRKLFIAN